MQVKPEDVLGHVANAERPKRRQQQLEEAINGVYCGAELGGDDLAEDRVVGRRAARTRGTNDQDVSKLQTK